MADLISADPEIREDEEDRLDEQLIERAMSDLDDDVARTGAACSDDDLNRTAERHGLSLVELAELRERAVASGVLAPSRRTGARVLEGGALDADEPSGFSAADSLDTLFRQLRRYPLLTAADEIALARKIENGDRAGGLLAEHPDHEKARALEDTVAQGLAAKQLMVASNIRLVIANAKSFRGQGLDFPDLIQAAIPGLIRAAEKFDYRMGYKFSTYATWWIRQSMARAIADTGRIIRLPVHVVERLNKFRRVHRRLLNQFGREPTTDELAAVLEWDPAEVTGLIQSIPTVISLDTPVGDDGGATVADLIASDEPPVFEQVADTVRAERLDQLLENLSYRERRVLELRFGLHGETPQTLDYVGQLFTVTRERIRQIEDQALKKLNAISAESGFRP